MNGIGPLTLWNGILPLLGLIAVALSLPAVMAKDTVSQRRLAGVIGVTGAAVWALAAADVAWGYYHLNHTLDAGLLVYLRGGALMGLLWGPVLALVWLMRAQGVERRKGLLMRNEGERR